MSVFPISDLPAILRSRACPGGLSHTGDDPAADHGHTDCLLFHEAATAIEKLGDALNAELARQPPEGWS